MGLRCIYYLATDYIKVLKAERRREEERKHEWNKKELKGEGCDTLTILRISVTIVVTIITIKSKQQLCGIKTRCYHCRHHGPQDINAARGKKLNTEIDWQHSVFVSTTQVCYRHREQEEGAEWRIRPPPRKKIIRYAAVPTVFRAAVPYRRLRAGCTVPYRKRRRWRHRYQGVVCCTVPKAGTYYYCVQFITTTQAKQKNWEQLCDCYCKKKWIQMDLWRTCDVVN